MIGPAILCPGDVVYYNHPDKDGFDLGRFVKITNWKTTNNGTDMVILNSVGSKISINELNVDWDITAFLNENGASS